MELNFLGRGSAFNVLEGSNSSYIIEGNSMLLIDCGETVYERLNMYNLLEGIDNVYVLVTHTHSDHIGSIGTLANYYFLSLNKKIHIILDYNSKIKDDIKTLLRIFGLEEHMYHLETPDFLDGKFKSFKKMRYQEITHCPQLISYAIAFDTEKGEIFYTGDTNDISVLKSLLERINEIDRIYIDTNTSSLPVHLNVDLLARTVPVELRKKVYCMHFNNDDCINRAKEYGFNIIKVSSNN